jgi:hypothetical protein
VTVKEGLSHKCILGILVINLDLLPLVPLVVAVLCHRTEEGLIRAIMHVILVSHIITWIVTKTIIILLLLVHLLAKVMGVTEWNIIHLQYVKTLVILLIIIQ